jgi:hypothetical protein
MANELLTHGDSSVVRDVQKEIEILTPVENLLVKNLKKTTARNQIHSWQTDTLATTASAAAAEFKAFAGDALSSPALVTNLVEHIYVAGSITEAQVLSTHESGQNEYSRQVAKKMMEWSNAAEFDLLRSSLVSGASGVAARMNGVIRSITTNTTGQTSGTVFSESILIGLITQTWENSNGEGATDILVGSILKSKISGFGTGIVKNVNLSENTAGQVVQVYESDFGTINVHLHRFIQQSADSTARIVGMRMDKYYLAYLNGQGVKLTDQAVRATSKDFVINGYLTLENRQQKCSFFANGYLKAV